MKRRIRLSESDLHRVIKESVKRVLNEADNYPYQDKGSGAWQFDVPDDDFNHNNIQAIMQRLLSARASINPDITFASDAVDSQKYADLLVKQIDQAIRTCKKYVEEQRKGHYKEKENA